MPKNIVFCADGTWNGPNADDDSDGVPDTTNVWKLFCALPGVPTDDTALLAEEQEIVEAGEGGQGAKYLHGVGDSRNAIIKLLGGVFGNGIIARIVRGYTFVLRNYVPGDSIILIGFSRGAYTARAGRHDRGCRPPECKLTELQSRRQGKRLPSGHHGMAQTSRGKGRRARKWRAD